jgi:hypothetical protein
VGFDQGGQDGKSRRAAMAMGSSERSVPLRKKLLRPPSRPSGSSVVVSASSRPACATRFKRSLLSPVHLFCSLLASTSPPCLSLSPSQFKPPPSTDLSGRSLPPRAPGTAPLFAPLHLGAQFHRLFFFLSFKFHRLFLVRG